MLTTEEHLDITQRQEHLLMTPSEQLLRFAADCKSMAKISSKNKPVWDGLAERWTRCAEWAERQSRAAEGLRAEMRLKRKDHRELRTASSDW